MATLPNVVPHILHVHKFFVQRTTFPCTLALPNRKITLVAGISVKAHFTLGKIHAVDVFEMFGVRRVTHTHCKAETAGGDMLRRAPATVDLLTPLAVRFAGGSGVILLK